MGDDYSKLYQQASEWCPDPDLADMSMRPQDVEEPLELVTDEEERNGDYDGARKVKIMNTETQSDDSDDRFGGMRPTAGDGIKEFERSPRNNSVVELGSIPAPIVDQTLPHSSGSNDDSGGSSDGVQPNLGSMFDFSSERQPSFVFGASSPPQVGTNGFPSASSDSPNSSQFSSSFNFNPSIQSQVTESQLEGGPPIPHIQPPTRPSRTKFDPFAHVHSSEELEFNAAPPIHKEHGAGAGFPSPQLG